MNKVHAEIIGMRAASRRNSRQRFTDARDFAIDGASKYTVNIEKKTID